MKPLRRLSLPTLLADRLDQDIKEGVWRAFLPGSRTLCERYDVSSRTCRATLVLLEERKVIEPAEAGKRRKISVTLGKAKQKLNNLLIIEDSLLPGDKKDVQLNRNAFLSSSPSKMIFPPSPRAIT